MAFRLAYLHLTLVHSKGQGQAHFDFNISQMVTDRTNITIASIIMSLVGFQLAYLELTLTYSKGQRGRRNDVSSNIVAFLLIASRCYSTE